MEMPQSAYTRVQFVVILFNFALTGWSLAKLSLSDVCVNDYVIGFHDILMMARLNLEYFRVGIIGGKSMRIENREVKIEIVYNAVRALLPVHLVVYIFFNLKESC